LPQSSPVHDLKFLFLHELILRPGVYGGARAVTICGRVLLLSRPHRITLLRIFPTHRAGTKDLPDPPRAGTYDHRRAEKHEGTRTGRWIKDIWVTILSKSPAAA
jgi:hypothetical protein